jgi:hypothetical protein
MHRELVWNANIASQSSTQLPSDRSIAAKVLVGQKALRMIEHRIAALFITVNR